MYYAYVVDQAFQPVNFQPICTRRCNRHFAGWNVVCGCCMSLARGGASAGQDSLSHTRTQTRSFLRARVCFWTLDTHQPINKSSSDGILSISETTNFIFLSGPIHRMRPRAPTHLSLRELTMYSSMHLTMYIRISLLLGPVVVQCGTVRQR